MIIYKLELFLSFPLVCSHVANSVVAIIGPASSTTVKASYPMAFGVDVPMIAPTATDPKLSGMICVL
jgi:ABC-type branched-subunit amino acid transport system substrate-binding protein